MGWPRTILFSFLIVFKCSRHVSDRYTFLTFLGLLQCSRLFWLTVLTVLTFSCSVACMVSRSGIAGYPEFQDKLLCFSVPDWHGWLP